MGRSPSDIEWIPEILVCDVLRRELLATFLQERGRSLFYTLQLFLIDNRPEQGACE